jgi:probable phosphoglycerate mutase
MKLTDGSVLDYDAPVTEVLLVRHALPTHADRPGHQPGLAAEGRRQADALAGWLAGPIDGLAASPLARARATAAPLASRLGLDVHVIDDLREWERDGGSPAYTPLEDMAADDPRALALAQGRYADFVPPFDRDAFRRQARSALDAICERWPTGRVVAFSHAGLINTLLAGVLGMDDIFWFLADYTSVSRVERLSSGRTVVRSVNETGHLEAAGSSIGRTGEDPSEPAVAARISA